MDKQPLVDFNQNLKPLSIKRIIRPDNIEEKLRKTLFPDGIKEVTIFIYPIEEFFDKFPLPEDCQKLVILHMLVTINELLEKSNFNDKELLELVLGYSSKIFLMSPEILSETKKINFIKEWKKLKKKYSHNQTTLEKLEEVFYFITYLQYSEPDITKETSKINQNATQKKDIMKQTEFNIILNNLLTQLFQNGIYKPVDITVFLLLACKVEGKEGIICDDDIMDKLGLTREEYIESIKRLGKHKIIATRIPTDDELKD